MDGFVSAWVSLQKLRGRVLFQEKVHHRSSVFSVLLCTFKIGTPAFASYWC